MLQEYIDVWLNLKAFSLSATFWHVCSIYPEFLVTCIVLYVFSSLAPSSVFSLLFLPALLSWTRMSSRALM